MIDRQKILDAKTNLDQLINGYNPLDSTPLADSDIVKNTHVHDCLSYISAILQQIVDGKLVSASSKWGNLPLAYSENYANGLLISDSPISLEQMVIRLHALRNVGNYQQLNSINIIHWLIQIGALKARRRSYSIKIEGCTKLGNILGFSMQAPMEICDKANGIICNRNAQKFILLHIQKVGKHRNKTSTQYALNQYAIWTPEQEEWLIELYNEDVAVVNIAALLMRTPTGIRAKLKKLGLIEHRQDAR